MKEDITEVVHQAFGKSDIILSWRELIGCERDSVIYITSGDVDDGDACATHEAISRAKQFLGIITLQDFRHGFYYGHFNEFLR